MLTKRIVPCLNIKGGRVVTGVDRKNLKDAGDPVELARVYNKDYADELCFIDIEATKEGREIVIDTVKEVADCIFIPLTVGGGVKSIEDFKTLLRAGADKVAVSTAVVKRPELIREAASQFGSQSVVVGIYIKKNKESGSWNVYLDGGEIDTGLDAVKWAKTAESYGAGEILISSMDYIGEKKGFDIEAVRAISKCVSIPVTIAGGAGCPEDFKQLFEEGLADGAAAASMFHAKDYTIKEVKTYLKKEGLPIRI